MFEQVIGQQHIEEQLKEQVQKGRIPHAQLWEGPEGSGLLAMVLAYAQYLQCTNITEKSSCGQCSHCNKASKHIHPDIHFSFPTVGAKKTSHDFMTLWRAQLMESTYFSAYDWLQRIDAGNKQGNIPRAECDLIIKRLSLKAFEGPYKIAIIWQAEYLGTEGNRLLKLIEEPPPKTLFILLTHDADSILPTIRSRCQLIHFPALDTDTISNALQQRNGLSQTEAQDIARQANGNFALALAFAQESEQVYTQRFIEWMRLCYALKPADLSAWIEQQHRNMGREDHKQFFKYALSQLRSLLMLKTNLPQLSTAVGQEQEALKKMANVMPTKGLISIVEIINQNIANIERNAHYKILMMNTSIRMHALMHAA